MIVNTGDWDAAVGTNAPGQSGDPESPFYSNLFKTGRKTITFRSIILKKKSNR
jgi:penicillin amidase